MNRRKRVYGLGCLKDPDDRRDIPVSLVLPRLAAPEEIDYASRMSPVRDQGEEGTCVGFAAVVGVKEYQEKKEHGTLIELSPRYLYAACKREDGIPHQEGTYPRTAMKILSEKGVCREDCWPYRPYQSDAPCGEADAQAASYRIGTYVRLSGPAEMERSLAVNGPFLAGVEVFPEWFDAPGGLIPDPADGSGPLGGHAVCVVGYSREGRYFKFKNSWGESWGERGYGCLGYDYMMNYCLDAWSATDLIADPQLLALIRERKSADR
ncbi:MAG TPA: C1 family peptidase [bacterium]|nr:C1 family peptidase [bacterium]HPQ66019.1 C1 family peptidase [bacterium]